MCGIFGMSIKKGALDPEQRMLLTHRLAIANDTRGKDSFSTCVIKDGEPVINRGLGLLQDHIHLLLGADTFFAHTRYATRGAKSVENAHMFEKGNIIGSHNGQISNWAELENKYPDRKKFQVDSEHIFAHLDENLPFNELEGYGAIEWVRRDALDRIYISKLRNGSLSVFALGNRNDKKPKGIIWTSDSKHMLEALYTCGLGEDDFYPYRIEEGATYFVMDGECYVAKTRKLELGAPNTTHKNYGGYWQGHGHPAGYEEWTGGGDTRPSNFSSTNNSSPANSNDSELEDWKNWQSWCKKRQANEERV